MSRRPVLVVTGAAVTAAAALAAVVVSTGALSATVTPGRSDGAAVAAPETKSGNAGATAKPLNARSVLLAAASTALREPAESGDYWYLRRRTTSRIDTVPGRPSGKEKELIALKKEMMAKEKELKDDPERLAEARKELERKSLEVANDIGLPYDAFLVETRETWRSMKPGGIYRSVSNQNPKVVFATPEDEAKWKADGAPRLAEDEPGVSQDNFEPVVSIGNPSLNIRNIGRLPTGKEGLESRLRELYKAASGEKHGFTEYVWSTSTDLMSAPIRPGTRAALFKILAEQPGITAEGQATDAAGRPGVALKLTDHDGDLNQMIIDEDTAELLQYELAVDGRPTLKETLEAQGWADRPGERPQG